MDQAFYPPTKTLYNATEFENEPSRWTLQEHIICPSCRNRAYWVRRSINGRPACFGSRPHVDGCDQATTSASEPGVLQPSEPIDNAGASLVIRPARNERHLHVRPDDDEETEPEVNRRGRGHQAPGGRQIDRRNMNLNRLLGRLLRDAAFRASTESLNIDGQVESTVVDSCIHVEQMNEALINSKRLFWGTIFQARPDEKGAWLNLGTFGSPTLRVSSEFLVQLVSAYNLHDALDLQGSAFIHWGSLRTGAKDGRFVLFPDTLDWFAVRLAHNLDN